MNRSSELDHRYVWHPFTQMKDWLRSEPIVISSGKGAVLRDVEGREYLDANSSIWTNLHGHGHPKIITAIQRQLRKVAHSSALGLANEPASALAERLVLLAAANVPQRQAGKWDSGKMRADHALTGSLSHFPTGDSKVSPTVGSSGALSKVFFSDDGSTAMEVALKLSYEFARRTGRSRKPRFLSLAGAYHGDTVGAVSLGHINLFHKAYSGLLFKSDTVPAPYCYRCPFNRAKPERADAREYRQCNWECVRVVERKFATQRRTGNPYAAFVLEPLMQGAAGMIPQPHGWLRQVAEIVRSDGAQLIADEVMTGFGRTGVGNESSEELEGRRLSRAPISTDSPAPIFACQHESVQPDLLALAKGLTGGYLPMAATLVTQPVFDAFLGEYSEFKTFFHGHSFTGNQLGASAALASLDLLQSPASLRARRLLENRLRSELSALWDLPQVGDIRQVGLVAGIELVRDWRSRAPFPLRERAGLRVCEAMAKRGVLTRPIGNVIVLMPPYCTTHTQLKRMISVLHEAIREQLPAMPWRPDRRAAPQYKA